LFGAKLKNKFTSYFVFSFLAVVLLIGMSPALADPPVTNPGPILPQVYCVRLMDVIKDPTDPEGDKFTLQFEVINWSNKQAGTLEFHLALPNLGNVVITGASIDPDGRPIQFVDIDMDGNLPPGDTDDFEDTNSNNVVDPGEDLNANQRLDNDPDSGKPPFTNDWSVTTQTSTAVLYSAGTPIPFLDLLGVTTTLQGFSLVPGFLAGITFIDTNTGLIPDGEKENVDDGINTLEGFNITIDGLEDGETVNFNWFLGDTSGNQIGNPQGGNAMGFGMFTLYYDATGAVSSTPSMFPAVPPTGIDPSFVFDGVWHVGSILLADGMPASNGPPQDFIDNPLTPTNIPGAPGGNPFWNRSSGANDFRNTFDGIKHRVGAITTDFIANPTLEPALRAALPDEVDELQEGALQEMSLVSLDGALVGSRGPPADRVFPPLGFEFHTQSDFPSEIDGEFYDYEILGSTDLSTDQQSLQFLLFDAAVPLAFPQPSSSPSEESPRSQRTNIDYQVSSLFDLPILKNIDLLSSLPLQTASAGPIVAIFTATYQVEPACKFVEASDPDNSESEFADGDRLTMYFNFPTNMPTISNLASFFNIFLLPGFGPANFGPGVVVTSTWLDAQTLQLDFTNTAGHNIPDNPGLVLFNPIGGNPSFTSQDGLVPISFLSCPVVFGLWGSPQEADSDGDGVPDSLGSICKI